MKSVCEPVCEPNFVMTRIGMVVLIALTFDLVSRKYDQFSVLAVIKNCKIDSITRQSKDEPVLVWRISVLLDHRLGNSLVNSFH